MKSLLLIFTSLLLLTCTQCTNSGSNSGGNFGVAPYKTTAAGLNWYTIEDLEKMKNIDNRKVLVDIYTSWCGWCKKLDSHTFTDPAVVEYLNKHYVLVKFDAEQKAPLLFKGETHEAVQMGRRKTNSLAIKFLNGRLGYPSLVFLDGGTLDKIKASAGFKTAPQLLQELQDITGA